MANEEKKNEVATTDNAEGEQVKHGWLRRAGGWVYHTFADTPTENNDNRDIVQVIADSVMGPTPGRKVARSSAAAGAGTAVAGIASGSITLLTIGGITFIVGGTAEAIQWYRGRNSDVVDAPEVTVSDEQAVEGSGLANAAKGEDNVHANLKTVACDKDGIFQLNEKSWNQIWGQAKSKALNPKNSKMYNAIVRYAAEKGLVTTKDPAPATT